MRFFAARVFLATLLATLLALFAGRAFLAGFLFGRAVSNDVDSARHESL